MEEDCEVCGGVLCPVEEEGGDGLIGLGGEGEGEGLGDVGVVGLPFCGGGAVDGRDGELAWLEIVRGADGEALCYVICYGGDVGDVAVGDCDGAVGGEHVGGCVAVSDLYGDGGVCEGHVCGCVRVWQAGEGCVCLICYGGDGPALPVEGAVLEIGDLRGQGRIDAKGEGGIEAESEVAEDSDLICAAVTCKEGIGRVGPTVESEVVYQLFRELEPGRAGVGLF